MTDYFALLGPLGYPLAACSIIALALTLERAIYFVRLKAPTGGQIPKPMQPAFDLLRVNSRRPRADRDEVVSLWVADYAKTVRANIGWLTLIASIAPMIGLLGTVLGMTRSFQAIAANEGPVSPNILADGLWEAMLTTLVGLSIAVPTLVAVWVFRALATRHVDRVAGELNRTSLRLDGVQGLDTGIDPESARAAMLGGQGASS